MIFLTVGLCGGFAIFSTFSMQSVRLFHDGEFLPLILYVAGTVVLCVMFAWLCCFQVFLVPFQGRPIVFFQIQSQTFDRGYRRVVFII